MRPTLRTIRLRAVWLIVLPFFVFARPTSTHLAVGSALAVLGLVLRGWAAGTIHKDERLTTSGPYAFVRHPLYLGSLILGLGVTVVGASWLWPALFLLFYIGVYARTMSAENDRLAALFPAHFPEYRAAVPALVPRPSPYASSAEAAGGFSWRQYRRNREWEAALGTAAALAVLALKGWAGVGIS